MNWSIISSVFFLATFKFMFAGIPGSVGDIPFLHTYFAAAIGGTISAAIFYFLSELFMMMSHKKLEKKRKEALSTGKVFKEKKKFTRMNKFVVRVKMKLGIVGISFLGPLLLSVPIGSIVTAKFYGKKKITFLLIALGMFVNATVTVGLAYIFK